MGTNYYFAGHQDDDDPQYHIGKRSAAGLYCWDCGSTLCRGGEGRIHFGGFERDRHWLTVCPKCGKAPKKENLEESSGGRELGFNKETPKRKSGVASCSSFTWAMSKLDAETHCTQPRFRLLKRLLKPVVNEYGDKFTWKEFLAILDECPVQYTRSIGTRFS